MASKPGDRQDRAFCSSTADLTEDTLSDWITTHPGRRPRTIEGLLRHLSAACTYGVKWGYLLDPFDIRPVSRRLPADELDESEGFRRHRTAGEIRR